MSERNVSLSGAAARTGDLGKKMILELYEKRGWVFVKKNTNNIINGAKISNHIEGSQEKREDKWYRVS